MVINRNDNNYEGGTRPETSMRPETSNYQNYNWNNGDNA